MNLVDELAAATNGNGAAASVRTTDELSRLLDRGPEWVEMLLEESERGGVVERIDGGWRLSCEGEKRFGAAFRALSLPRDGA